MGHWPQVAMCITSGYPTLVKSFEESCWDQSFADTLPLNHLSGNCCMILSICAAVGSLPAPKAVVRLIIKRFLHLTSVHALARVLRTPKELSTDQQATWAAYAADVIFE